MLKERAKLEKQFEIFKNMHQETIDRLISEFYCTEEDVLTTLYLSKFVVTGDITSTTQTQTQQYLTDDERTELILTNMIESKKYLPAGLNLKTRVMLQQLTWQIGWEIEKVFRRNFSGKLYPLDVIYVHVIDQLLVPLINEYYTAFSEEQLTQFDFRWILSEILSSLENSFPINVLKKIKSVLPSARLHPEDFFFAGWVVCDEYMHYLFPKEAIPNSPNHKKVIGEDVEIIKDSDFSQESNLLTTKEIEVNDQDSDLLRSTSPPQKPQSTKALESPTDEMKNLIKMNDFVQRDLRTQEETARPSFIKEDMITKQTIKLQDIIIQKNNMTEVPVDNLTTDLPIKNHENLPLMKENIVAVESRLEYQTPEVLISPNQGQIEERPAQIEDYHHRHLTDELTFGGLIIYDLETQLPLHGLGNIIITSRGPIELTNEDLILIKNLISIDHPVITQSNHKINNSNFSIQLMIEKTQKVQRFLYLNHLKDENLSIGIWSFFLLQSEDINNTYLEKTLKGRLPNILSLLKLKKTIPSLQLVSIIKSWIETLIADLQDDISYIGHIEDIQKTQKYWLSGFSKATLEHQSDTLVYESVVDSQRIQEKSESDYLSNIKGIFHLADFLTTLGLNLFQKMIEKLEIKLTGFTFNPSELYFSTRNDEKEQLLLYSVSMGENADNPEVILTAIAKNRSLGDIAHRGKTNLSRRNIQRAVRLIGETRKTKNFQERIKERMKTAFSHQLQEHHLKVIWKTFFDLHSKQKSIPEITDLSESILESIKAKDQEQKLENEKLINNVIFYLIKDMIIPMNLLKVENLMLSHLKASFDLKEIQKLLDSNKRKTKCINERIETINGSLMQVIKKYTSIKVQEDLKQIVQLCIDELRQFVSKMTEAELKNILISI